MASITGKTAHDGNTEEVNFSVILKHLSNFMKIKWNKYRSEMTKQTKTNNLNYLIEPTFSRFNRLFAL